METLIPEQTIDFIPLGEGPHDFIPSDTTSEDNLTFPGLLNLESKGIPVPFKLAIGGNSTVLVGTKDVYDYNLLKTLKEINQNILLIVENILETINSLQLPQFILVNRLPEANDGTVDKVYAKIVTDRLENVLGLEEYLTKVTLVQEPLEVGKSILFHKEYSWQLVGRSILNLDNYYTKNEADSNLLNILTSKYYSKDEIDLKLPFNTLKEEPDSYIRNVHYTTETGSYIGGYTKNTELFKSSEYDKPNPVTINEVGIYVFGSKTAHYSQDTDSGIGCTYIYNLIPGNRYFYKKGLVWKSFVVEKTRRFINVGAYVKNVRDLGGISLLNGGNIAYNKIIRGSEIKGNVITKLDVSKLRELGIRFDLDLRNDSEIEESNARNGYSDISSAISYKRINGFPDFGQITNLTSNLKDAIKEAFETVIDLVLKGNLIYLHCQWGVHRAGLLSAIIEGVLGVSQGEIDKDYELSSFSSFGIFKRTDEAYRNGINYIQNEFGGSWERFLLYCGVDRNNLESFKGIMITDRNEKISTEYQEVTYKELLNLKNNGFLIPGAKYRMIDYETLDGKEPVYHYYTGLSDVPNFKSAHKPFDLVLTALSNNELDCNVKAVHSERDTEGYFTNVDLSKWELKYDIENSKKYNWAINDDVVERTEKVYVELLDNQMQEQMYYEVYYRSDTVLFTIKASNSAISSTGTVVSVFDDSYKELLGKELFIDWRSDFTNIIGLSYIIGDTTYLVPYYTTKFYYNKNIYKHIDGKGVIYYMKDENNNELPFDFKNILLEKELFYVPVFNTYKTYSNELRNVSPMMDNETPLCNVENISYGGYTKYRITGLISESLTIGSISYSGECYITNEGELSVTVSNKQLLSGESTLVKDSVLTVSSSVPFNLVISCKVSEYLEHEAVNVTIKPYISGGILYLNSNIFTAKEDEYIKEVFFDNNCYNNYIEGNAINCTFKANSSGNKLKNAENCKFGLDSTNIIANNAESLYVGNECFNLVISRAYTSKYVKIDDYLAELRFTIQEKYRHIVNSELIGLPYEWMVSNTDYNNALK